MKARGKFSVNSFKYSSKAIAYRVTGTTMRGIRVRENYKSEPEALARKQQLEIEALNFTPEQRITTTRLTPAQITDAELAYSELGDQPILKAIRFFKENYREPVKTITAQKAFVDFLEDKRRAGLRDASLRALKTRVGFLVKKFPEKLVSDLQPAHVNEAAAQPGVTESTIQDNRRSISSFFSWAIDNEYCLSNPAKKSTRRRGTRDDSEPVILSLEEARKFLEIVAAYKKGKLVPYVSLALFAGIRPTELARLTWDNIDLNSGTITIGAKLAKMRQRRIVEMPFLTEKNKKGAEINLPANLLAWLTPFAAEKPPLRGPNWRKDFDSIKLAAGYGNPEKKPAGGESEEAKQKRLALKRWTPDILRHTAISNHLACFQHEGKTAAWAGNSPDIIQRHYKGLVKPTAAREFWKILPNNPGPTPKH